MPVLASPSRTRLGLTSNLYGPSSTSSSAYSRSSTTFSSRTSSLDRSPYSAASSYISSYKFSSPAITKDYASIRPPTGSSRTSSSFYSTSSTSRVSSPARSYFSTRGKSTSDENGVVRIRETQSETRETSDLRSSGGGGGGGSNNNYLAGSIKRSRDISAATTALSRFRPAERNGTNNGSSTVRSKYSTDYAESGSGKPELTKTERLRSYQTPPPSSASRETAPFRSRFLRSSLDSAPAAGSSSSTSSRGHVDVDNGPDARADARPSVSSLRRRYDLNCNPVADSVRNSVRNSNSPTPDRCSNGESSGGGRGTHSAEDTSLLSVKDAGGGGSVATSRARATSPTSTLSSLSDNENNLDGNGRTLKTPKGSRTTTPSATRRCSDSDEDSETASPSVSVRIRSTQPAIRTSRKAVNGLSDESGLVGFRNIGNTCFMNSVLQCLSNTRAVLDYVISEEYTRNINTTTSSMNGALIKAFASVLSELWTPDEDEGDPPSAVNPTALKSQIQKFAPRFMGYNQQDSQEFLRYLLEGLHEDVNRVAVKTKPLETDIPDDLSDSDKATESWRRYLRRDDSRIVDLFVGQLKSTLQCTVCGHCSVTFDPFWDLSLPIPSNRSSSIKLHHCLDLFAKEEILDGDEKPTCSKCQTRRKCTKKFSIHKFPQILVLHLKRFSPGERFRKLDANVDFALTDLDMSPYLAPGVTTSSCNYQLYGVINHSGSAYSGHYNAFCRHPISGVWHEYNDSRVSNINAQRVVSSEAYLLFYEAKAGEARL